MSDLKEEFSDLITEGQLYVEKKLEQAKLEVVDKTATSGGVLLSILLIIGIALIFFGILGVALALWIGALLNSYILGTLITAGFFLLFLILIIVFRRVLIVNPFRNQQLGKYLKENEK